MKATGKIKIEEGLELNNPTLEINTVNYDWINHSVSVECLFQEESSIYKHSRSYNFPTDGGGALTAENIISFVNSHEILSIFA